MLLGTGNPTLVP